MSELQLQSAQVSGEVGRIPAAEKQAVLQAGDAILKATIHITRAATGKVETYEITGTVPKEQ